MRTTAELQIVRDTYVTPLDHQEVPKQYQKNLISWRHYAMAVGYKGPLAWQVSRGFTLKHAPLAGPCYKNLENTKTWEFQNNEPTSDSIVWWIPRLVTDSTSKNISEMEALRTKLRQRFTLPEHHATRFGSAALLVALVLAHYQHTRERVPLKYFYTVTDTILESKNRVIVGNFQENSGLRCYYCYRWEESAYNWVGFFLLGIDNL